jgi:hypothetical protein
MEAVKESLGFGGRKIAPAALLFDIIDLRLLGTAAPPGASDLI